MFQSEYKTGMSLLKRPLNSDLAVQDHNMLRVRGQPGLHGFTYGADLIQRWGMQVGPAEVLNLLADGRK